MPYAGETYHSPNTWRILYAATIEPVIRHAELVLRPSPSPGLYRLPYRIRRTTLDGAAGAGAFVTR